MAAKKYVQSQTLYLAGSGSLVGAVNIVLTSLTDIYGNAITNISSFGDKGYVTLEPDTVNEEAATFTTITANANGTVTLGGVSTVLGQSPYTETSGLVRAHSGGTKVVITDNVAFWATFANKNNAETILGKYTFPNAARPTLDSDVDTAVVTDFPTFGQLSRVVVAGAANASTTVKGIVQEATQAQVLAKTAAGSTGAELYINPATLPSTLLSDYKADTGAANAYAIAPAPAITAYVTGQTFSFSPANTSTGASTINVNALGVKNIYRNGGALVGGEIQAGQIAVVVYDGIQFELFAQSGTPSGVMSIFAGSAAPSGWLLCDGTSYLRATYPGLFAVIGTTFGSVDGTHFNVPDMRSRMPVGVGTGTKVFTFASRATNTITVTGAANSATNDLQTGQAVFYNAATTAMTGLTNNTTYYLIRVAYNQFQLSATLPGAVDNTGAITLSSDGVGTQTFTVTLSVRALADTGGEEAHNITQAELASHSHVEQIYTTGSAGTSMAGGLQNATPTTGTTPLSTTSVGSDIAHNNMPAFLALNYIIKS